MGKSARAWDKNFCVYSLTSDSQSGRNRPFWSDFERQGSDSEAIQHNGGENAQPLIGH